MTALASAPRAAAACSVELAADGGAKALRLGICGHGWVIDRCYAPALRRPDSPFRVAAVADTGVEARARAVTAWRQVAVGVDITVLLAAEVDAVLVASPSSLHLDHVLAVLGAGLPCLVEKPMLRDSLDLAALERAGEGRLLVPAVACRHRADTRRWLAEVGKLGELERLSLSWRRHRGVPSSAWHHHAAEGWTGVFADLGAHLVDILGAAMGWNTEALERDSLCRRTDRDGGTAQWYGGAAPIMLATDTTVAVTLRAKNLLIDLDVAWVDDAPGDLLCLSATGASGSAVLEGLFGFSDERRVPHQRVSRFGRDGRSIASGDFEPGPALQRAGFEAVLDGFAGDIVARRQTDWRPIRFAAAIGDLVGRG